MWRSSAKQEQNESPAACVTGLCNLGRSGNCQKESRPTDDVRLLSSLCGDSTSFQLIILKQMSAATLDIPPTYLLIDSTMIFQFSVTVLLVLP